MISEQHDPAFWAGVAAHPEVARRMGETTQDQIEAILARPGLIPLASKSGGFLFQACDSFARVCELHTLYRPEGWGREVHDAAVEAFTKIFSSGFDLVVTYEMADNSLSKPPRSFGFVSIGDFEPSKWGDARTWMLTKTAWLASPAGSR